jgi:hypothetical protein
MIKGRTKLYSYHFGKKSLWSRTAAFDFRDQSANGCFCFLPMTAMGTEHSVATDRFQEAEFHWPHFGNEFEEVTVASVPRSD